MIELTPEQRRELDTATVPRAVDPQTHKTYVLVSEEVYERMLSVLDGDGLDMRQVAVLVEQAMREDDGDDPGLAGYQIYRNPS